MDYTENYRAHLRNLIAALGEKEAMKSVVGGEFEAVGKLEASLLANLGVSPSATLLDIGCGTGRLAYALKESHTGTYVGTDILQELLTHCDQLVQRADWKYYVSSAPPLPLPDSSVDVICLFSVFTHLLDEDVFEYLREIKRLLVPGGLVIFSYLDFSVRSHWTVFEQMLKDPLRVVLNRFTSKDSLAVLIKNAGLDLQEFRDGDLLNIQVTEPIRYSDGRVEEGFARFGQSVCICRRAA